MSEEQISTMARLNAERLMRGGVALTLVASNRLDGATVYPRVFRSASWRQLNELETKAFYAGWRP